MHLTDHWLKPQFPLIYTRFGPKPHNLMQDWMEEGIFLDHFTGQSISTKLRSLSVQEREEQLDPALRPIFPDFEARSYPPTYFLHGAEDSLGKMPGLVLWLRNLSAFQSCQKTRSILIGYYKRLVSRRN